MGLRQQRYPPPPAEHLEFLNELARLLASEAVSRISGQSGPRPPRKSLDESSTITDGMDDEPSNVEVRQS